MQTQARPRRTLFTASATPTGEVDSALPAVLAGTARAPDSVGQRRGRDDALPEFAVTQAFRPQPAARAPQMPRLDSIEIIGDDDGDDAVRPSTFRFAESLPTSEVETDAGMLTSDEVSGTDSDATQDDAAPTHLTMPQQPCARVDGIEVDRIHVIPFGSQEDEPLVRLSAEQRAVVFRALAGESILITGGAGCGKSVVLRQIGRLLPRDGTAVTATTGIAALQVDGRTIHSWSGLGMYEAGHDLAYHLRDLSAAAKTRWKETRTLIIDEVSMLDGEMFECLDEMGKVLRADPRPFGGLQLVLCGDFMQLPPVSDNRTRASKFVFNSKSYKALNIGVALLSRAYRQDQDDRFAELLNHVRKGTLTERHGALLNATACKPLEDDGPPYVRLRSTNREVKEVNDKYFDRLDTPCVTFRARDSPHALDEYVCGVGKIITLRKGARVMLRKNMDARLVNGSCGVVHELVPLSEVEGALLPEDLDALRRVDATHCPLILFDGHPKPVFMIPQEISGNRDKLETRLQLPLQLAWAITIHKSQGMTLDRVDIDFAKAFAAGQVYVALSRGRSLDGVRVTNLHPSAVKVNEMARGFYAFHNVQQQQHTDQLLLQRAQTRLTRADLDRARDARRMWTSPPVSDTEAK